MKGLELSKQFYLEYGAPMLKDFPELLDKIAIGLIGSGSECFGYDDEISQNHDFEPGFCIFLPDEAEVDSKSEFLLERAYLKLPKEYMSYKRSNVNPVGGSRHGVIRMRDFFREKTGTENGDIVAMQWFYISEQALLEATNGEVFYDGLGRLTEIRKKLAYLPEDVRLKKLAGNLLLMAQAGQYNYNRCAKRGETGGAQLSIFEFVNATLKVIFLLNKRYIPYYKWTFHALKELPILSHLSNELEYLISSPNDEKSADVKKEIIERISLEIINELKNQELTRKDSTELECHAYSVNDRIKSPNIRNLNVLFAV